MLRIQFLHVFLCVCALFLQSCGDSSSSTTSTTGQEGLAPQTPSDNPAGDSSNQDGNSSASNPNEGVVDCNASGVECWRLNIVVREPDFNVDCDESSQPAIDQSIDDHAVLLSDLTKMIIGDLGTPVTLQGLMDYFNEKCEVDATQANGKPYRLSHIAYHRDGLICGDCESASNRAKYTTHCKQNPSDSNFGEDFFGMGVVCTPVK